MRLVFAGTPDAAVPSLRRLASSDHDLAAIVTRRDAPIGRKRVLTPSPVAIVGVELGIPTIKTDRLDAAATSAIVDLAPDLGVIVAYGGLVREPLLSVPRLGWINLHFSLLPRWRGAAPVQRALIAGDRVTGASVFQLVPELDAGDIFETERLTVPDGATAGDVLTALSESGARLLLGVVDALAAGTARAHPQQGEPTLAPKLTIDDGALDWHEPAERVLARFAGVTPEPGAHTTVGGARLKIIAARPAVGDALAPGELASAGGAVLIGTGTTPIELVTVQPAGKALMRAADWFRGLRLDAPVAGA
ncbi:methionyl-tRNA formyltransferase [Microbacterium rhizomatis]|uniref:Methionyl-tRNA formyltransferase n=1 Tax=Microbacterium rhizomatis TaxID=1631477 RepID=A0A5J5J2W6_9MICO|nr:methionyl-tRNA formyltransferase [Microbacterium rhizomatis]KAA9110577.1 methionyl-tRNA formyltransferase [Microbacterium rhizomatis]